MKLRVLVSMLVVVVGLGLVGCGGGGDDDAGNGADVTPVPEPTPEPTPDPEPMPDPNAFDFPLRSLFVGENWGTNTPVVEAWEATGKSGPLILPDYIAWLDSLHVNWIGLSAALHYDDSMDSTVERVYSADVDTATYSDDALRQMIREFRSHGINVYLTLAFQAFEAETATHPVCRWQLGDPGDANTGVPPDPPDACALILPEFWPWRPDHPDHDRFVAEFWETYTQQAVHFARMAEDEGVSLYSLGTETERLFRTRSGGYWPNHFRHKLQEMVDRVRAVYSGRLTYDMHFTALTASGHFGPGSNHLWDDLDLDIVGISAWFPLVDSIPSMVLSVERLQESYERIFRDYLVPLQERNPDRPIMFLEYGALDTVETPSQPGDASLVGHPVEFSDSNDNGLDDGQEAQANVYQALLNTMDRHPGVLNGVFYWDNWIANDDLWEWWADHHAYGIRDKLAEDVVRSAYERYKQ